MSKLTKEQIDAVLEHKREQEALEYLAKQAAEETRSSYMNGAKDMIHLPFAVVGIAKHQLSGIAAAAQEMGREARIAATQKRRAELERELASLS